MVIQFSQNTTNNLSSIYKSGNMFQLIEPSSGQLTNHIESTFNIRAHCGIPNVYKLYENKMYEQLFDSQYILI